MNPIFRKGYAPPRFREVLRVHAKVVKESEPGVG